MKTLSCLFLLACDLPVQGTWVEAQDSFEVQESSEAVEDPCFICAGDLNEDGSFSNVGPVACLGTTVGNSCFYKGCYTLCKDECVGIPLGCDGP